ncbi:MAG: sulfite exporter TauE/SafE family protein [Pseudomonadota bacterium]
MSAWLAYVGLTAWEAAYLAAVVFAAGMVRGFSGFALSALVMASAAIVLSPIQLIPILWWLETAATLLMVRGGWRDADRRIAVLLVLGGMMGQPIGLYLTTTLPVDQSRMIALCMIILLALLQLAKVRFAFLATTMGVVLSGVMAGLATGLAMVGGMVVALYVLSQDRVPMVMRATLVLYLAISSTVGLAYQVGFGIMDWTGIARGLSYVPIVIVGVLVGQAMFRPRLERYYKPFCLILLMLLAASGLVRLAIT